MGKAIFKPSAELAQIVGYAHTHHQPVLFVKDQGLYLMTRGLKADAKTAVVAYAEGCNPKTDDFDTWWDNARAIAGGDDFGEEIEAAALAEMIKGGNGLQIRLSATHMDIRALESA